MRVLLAGGGTAGHINPALAVAQYIKKKQPDAEILFIGNADSMESRLVKREGFDFASIDVRGFRRKLNWTNIKHDIGAFRRMFTSSSESARIIKDFNPDIAIGTGGYVAGPVIRKCQQLGVPTIIHESNAFPGVTTKMLCKKAKAVMLAVEDAKKHLPEGCVIKMTGNPLREDILTADKQTSRRELSMGEKPLVLSFGGSLGADKINAAVAELIKWNQKEHKCCIIHGTGRAGYVPFIKLLEEKGVVLGSDIDTAVRDYIDDMPRCMAAADLVISRSGAMTLSEIQAQGKASLLIPSPNVAENHQYHNAMSLVNKDAGEIIEEKDLTPQTFIEKVNGLISDPERLQRLGCNAKKMAITDARERIYDIILETLKNEKNK
ncbi:MAG: undecaprenyldiphospho-muramoylpentapeptide beta-N-acetylglucosaminyltransferase [Clostridia bacterium]|nr:undecaprenyldiphospho-muramoylpentapeptide beta-N-acetylglucosaminyltransferase [Clostridia bacterium]